MISRRVLLMAGLLAPGLARAQEKPVLRLGILPFGTVSWEAEIIRRRGLDEAAGYRLETLRLANNDAARVAFQAGQVDLIVSDLLLAARFRNEGRALKFLPYSATEGALMVPGNSAIRSVADLKGKRVGVAGGALDKSWLLLRIFAKEKNGFDPASDSSPSYGAPPLLTRSLETGDLDAALLYWQFCARLEAKGFRKLIGVGEIMRAFGLDGDISLLGYIFDEALVDRAPRLMEGFAQSSLQAKRILATDDEAWAAIRPMMEAEDDATFQALRRYFIEGIPRRSVEVERADAERLYEVLAQVGGEKLVGAGSSLPDGLYWNAS